MAGNGIDLGGSGPAWAAGLMSGTSMDGVDAAMLLTDGETVEAFGPALELAPAYNRPARERLLRAGEAAEAELLRGAAPDTGLVEAAALAVDRIHAAAAETLRARSDEAPAVLGYHGQTVFHAPEIGRTVQLGDGARLAEATGLPVVWDFRSADMEAGGEGAPLAPFYHFALARRLGARAPLAFLNLGGVGNLTWIDPAAPAPEAEGALFAFDTGPANALVDDWMTRHGAGPCDRDGAAASAGTVRLRLTDGNAIANFLARPGPKSLDRNAFALALDRVRGLSLEDGAATLTALTADCVVAALPHLPSPPARWLVCGGGRRNPAMMAALAERLGVPVEPVESAGLDGDALEAQAFAYLAVRVARGLPTSAPATTGCRAPVSGGRITLPAGPASSGPRTR